MKHIALLTTLSCLLPLHSFSSDLKGGDFIPTDVGAKYTYNTTVKSHNISSDSSLDKKSDNISVITTTLIKSCDKSKTQCIYENTDVAKGIPNSEYSWTQIVKDGALYQLSGSKERLLIPRDVTLNKTKEINYSGGDTHEKVKVTKILPTFKISNKNYTNCIKINRHSETSNSNLGFDMSFNETSTYCAKIGLVKSVSKTKSFFSSINSTNITTQKSVLSSIQIKDKLIS